MVCSKCQGKLKGLACPDPWKSSSRPKSGGKSGASPSSSSSSSSSKGPTRSTKAYDGKAKKGPVAGPSRYTPYKKGQKKVSTACRICQASLLPGHYYCQDCSYRKGICSMCGKKILDTSSYKQSS